MRGLLLVVALAACHKPDPNCERAVHHVFELTTSGPKGSKPSAEEQKVIDQIAVATLDQCTREGLSDAQRECILAAKALTERSFLTCPALVAKPPSWIIAPIGHPEAVDTPPPVAPDDSSP